jgi:hypothetical protein
MIGNSAHKRTASRLSNRDDFIGQTRKAFYSDFFGKGFQTEN